MPSPFNLYRDCFQRKADGRPGLLDFQTDFFQVRGFQKEHFCKAFGRPFQEPEGMCGQKLLNLPADLSIVNRIRQFIGQSGSSGIRVQGGGNDKFLPQNIFLRKHTMVRKYLKILYLNFIHISSC